MTFVINAIKQDSENKLAVEFLLDVDSQLLSRKIIEKTGLVLLSLKEYSGDKNSFGPLYLSFLYETGPITIVGNKDANLKDLCLLFVSLGMEVTDLNYFDDVQTPEQVKKIIDFCKNEYSESQNKIRLEHQQQQASENKIYYSSEGLDKAKQVISWVIDKVTILLEEKGAYISSKDLRTIKEKIEELKKMRMGTNYEKIRDMLQELFSLVDHIEEDYFASLQGQGELLFSGTEVTLPDLEQQVSILEKVQQQQLFGGSVPTKRQDYVAFGRNLLYLVFLKKDFFALRKNIPMLSFALFDYFQIGVMMILVFLGLCLMGNKLWGISFSLGSVYMGFVSLGLLGLLVSGAVFLRRSSLVYNFFLLVVVLVLYNILLPILKNSFALG